MFRVLKRSLCVFLSFTVLVFSCVFMPKQKAEALSEVGIIGTVGGLMGLALLTYGVCVNDPAVFNSNDMMTQASAAFLSAVGLGAFTYDSPISYAAYNATSWLAAAKEYANAAYSSGACSSVIQGPGILVDNFKPMSDNKSLYFDFVSGSFDSLSYRVPSDEVGSYSSIFDLKAYDPDSLYEYLSIFYDGSSVYFLSNCSFGSNSRFYYQFYSSSPFVRDSSFLRFDFNYNGVYYQSFSSDCASFIVSSLQTLGYPLASSDITFREYIDNYLVDFDGAISADEYLANPVIPGACDVFNSSRSLDSYHVDSPGNDVLDIGNLLEKTGCDTVDDVLTKVRTGELSVADVQIGLGTQPYIDVDVDTGTIAIPGETVNSRPIALTPDLAIPADITIADTYVPANPPLDDTNTDRPSLPKGSYVFPLADFFPFCLPWDIYKVLKVFNAKPKAPVITIPLGSFFSSIPGVDDSTTDYVFTFDLGEDQFEKWFIILRNLEKIGIVIGFVLVSRQLIHGGD